MKKILTLLTLFLSVSLPVSAAKNDAGNQNSGAGQQVQHQTGENQQVQLSPDPTAGQAGNYNRVKTQNQSEELQLRTQTQEQESVDLKQGGGSHNRNQSATQAMGAVSLKTQELLRLQIAGGVGDQVRQVVREQNQAHFQIQEQLNRLDTRPGLTKLLFGTDFSAVGVLKQQQEKNRLRIQQLNQIQTQLSNRGDINTIQEAVLALNGENISLQERISAEEQTRSMFGWILRLFAESST